MISTNLSTRPFYNERLVRTILAVVVLLVLGVTALNVWTVVTLSGRDAVENAQAARAETKAAAARRAATRIRRSIDATQLAEVTTAAAEANRLIDARTFSWTDLLNRLETTLPADVRIASIKPVAGADDRLSLRLVVLARRPEDVDAFEVALEKEAGFRDVVSMTESTTPEGLLEVALQGEYLPK